MSLPIFRKDVALCINQKDVAERQSQVRMMGAIYGKAEHVLCWLGPFDDHDEDVESRARLAIRFLRTPDYSQVYEGQPYSVRTVHNIYHRDTNSTLQSSPSCSLYSDLR